MNRTVSKRTIRRSYEHLKAILVENESVNIAKGRLSALYDTREETMDEFNAYKKFLAGYFEMVHSETRIMNVTNKIKTALHTLMTGDEFVVTTEKSLAATRSIDRSKKQLGKLTSMFDNIVAEGDNLHDNLKLPDCGDYYESKLEKFDERIKEVTEMLAKHQNESEELTSAYVRLHGSEKDISMYELDEYGRVRFRKRVRITEEDDEKEE